MAKRNGAIILPRKLLELLPLSLLYKKVYSQAAATEMRSKENADYVKASTDFKESAEAVAKAIEVLKAY